MVSLRPFLETDLPQIVDLQTALYPKGKNWSLEYTRSQLTDTARDKGRNVTIATENDRITGVAAWVFSKETEEFFGVPFFAANSETLTILLQNLINQADALRAKYIRVVSHSFELEKVKILSQRGFQVSFNFLELELALKKSLAPQPVPFTFAPGPSVDPEKYKTLYNESFMGVSNAPPVSVEEAKELWASPLWDKNFSGVWLKPHGEYAAFLLVDQKGYIDSIGVHPSLQNQGLGVKIYEQLFYEGLKRGLRHFNCIVADNNLASLKFHQHFGFTETARRSIWQLPLENFLPPS